MATSSDAQSSGRIWPPKAPRLFKAEQKRKQEQPENSDTFTARQPYDVKWDYFSKYPFFLDPDRIRTEQDLELVEHYGWRLRSGGEHEFFF